MVRLSCWNPRGCNMDNAQLILLGIFDRWHALPSRKGTLLPLECMGLRCVLTRSAVWATSMSTCAVPGGASQGLNNLFCTPKLATQSWCGHVLLWLKQARLAHLHDRNLGNSGSMIHLS